jgi:hypothetical protein
MSEALLAEFEALELPEKMILALLALMGDPVGRTAILDQLVKAGINDANGQPFTVLTLDDPLIKLERLAFTSTPGCAGPPSAPPSALIALMTCAWRTNR